MQSELKPCPFCGSNPEIIGGTSTTVRCSSDQCVSRFDLGPYNDYGHYASAIAAWNHRAVDADTPQVPHGAPFASDIVERLDALIEQQRIARGDMLYYGKPDQALVDAAAEITRLTSQLRAAEEREKALREALKMGHELVASVAKELP